MLFIAITGWAIAGLMALALVSRVGWLGVLILGLAVLMVALRAELDADSPAVSDALMRRQYEQIERGRCDQSPKDDDRQRTFDLLPGGSAGNCERQ